MARRYDVVGFLGEDFGLSVAARNTIRALTASGRCVKAVPVEPKIWKGPAPESLTEAPSANGGAVNLFHLNPVEIALFSRQWRGAVDPRTANVCVPFWELPLVPQAWVPMLAVMDMVLAPTRFVQTACASAIAADSVLHYPQAVFLPGEIRPAREAWGLARDVTVFLVTFDLGSDIERKNPWAAIDAFRQAFPSDPDVRLVIKARARGLREHREQLAALAARAGSDRRMVFVDAALSYREVLELYASCDVMLSLHRSEGLGLHLMEAMTLGKVVVATNWSGNQDYMTPQNSVLIGHRLVPVDPSHAHYRDEVGRPGQLWAEPSLEDAVSALRILRAQADRRAALGSNAASDMDRRRGDMLAGGAFDALEAALAGTPSAGALRGAVIRRTRRRGIWREVRAGCRGLANRMLRG